MIGNPGAKRPGPLVEKTVGWRRNRDAKTRPMAKPVYDVQAEARKGRWNDPGEGPALLGAMGSGWNNARARDVIEHGHMHASSDCWR